MTISLGKVFEPFVEQRPICVMARGVLENLFNADKIGHCSKDSGLCVSPARLV